MIGRVLITGANGFVGLPLIESLFDKGVDIVAAVRSEQTALDLPACCRVQQIGSIEDFPTWSDALQGVDAVVHLAARVHLMQDDAPDPLAEFRRVNVEGTRHLVTQCVTAQVKRFVYLSSVKAVGDGGPSAYTETDMCRPQDPYGISKMEAEDVVREIGRKHGIETVILRPPVVYGPRVRANILRLMQLAVAGVPLPLGSVRNLRSFVYIGNLVSAIELSLNHPKAAGETFFVADDCPVSSREFVDYVARQTGKPPRLLHVPQAALRAIGVITGKSAAIGRLTGSLVLDITKIRETLNWMPPYSMEEGMRTTVEWFLENNRSRQDDSKVARCLEFVRNTLIRS